MMIRRSANAEKLIPMHEQSESNQKSFFDRVLSSTCPSFFLPTDEVITELKKCIAQGSYASPLAESFLKGVGLRSIY